MPRRPRAENQNGWHHVTNRGADRQVVFRSTDDRVDFGRLLESGCDEFGVEVFAYCLMDNHFHLVLNCPEGGLSSFMQHLGGKYTRHANKRRGGDGPINRGRFSSRAILSEQYLLNAVRYVHRNPLDIRPPVGVEEYRWSSHRTYVGLRPRPRWLALSPVLDWFDSAQSFHELVCSDVDPCTSGLDLEVFRRAVEHVVDEMSPMLGRAPQGVVRTAMTLALDRLDEPTRAMWLGQLTDATAESRRRAARRARQTAADNAVIQSVLTRALDLVAAPDLSVSTTWGDPTPWC